MRTKIKLLISVLVVCLSLILVACGQTAKPDQEQTDKQEQNKLDNNKNKDPKKYTVNFYDGNTLLNSKTVNENNTVSPITPSEKEGYEFMGWYTDSSMTTKFQNDTKITSDTNLYASYMDFKEMFAAARAATIDNGKFKYDYKLDFSILKKFLDSIYTQVPITEELFITTKTTLFHTIKMKKLVVALNLIDITTMF